MKKLMFGFLCLALLLSVGCNKRELPTPSPDKYPNDVAVAWMKLHIRLTRSTPNFNSVVSDRSFGYAGLVLYEAIAPGIGKSASFLPSLTNAPELNAPAGKSLFWPASANAAMASITRDLFGNATAAGLASIDSLEQMFATGFQSVVDPELLKRSVDFGHATAEAIFEWSKTDGGHEAYNHLISPEYVPPVGEGLWIPTPPLFGPPILPYWGNNRSFLPNIAARTQPPAPIPYSKEINSPFYNMVNELYTISLSLSHEDTVIARFWADVPGMLNVPAHATNILTQLVVLKSLDLQSAAKAYALHGISMYDASISVFKTKYQYTLVRPVSYIRNVMLHSSWNSVIPTPPHPEYTAAHAVVSGASAAVLENIFGKDYAFSDHTYDLTLGTRSYASFDAYASEAGRSRLLGGIHYGPSIKMGIAQGRAIGNLVNALPYDKPSGKTY